MPRLSQVLRWNTRSLIEPIAIGCTDMDEGLIMHPRPTVMPTEYVGVRHNADLTRAK